MPYFEYPIEYFALLHEHVEALGPREPIYLNYDLPTTTGE